MPRFDDPDLARIPKPDEVNVALGGYFPGDVTVRNRVSRTIGTLTPEELAREEREQEQDYVELGGD